MVISQKLDTEAKQITEDIQTLEIEIRRLKIEYDRYFIGARKKEPVQLLWNIKKVIKRYSETPFRQYQHRFQYNTLVGRFNVLNERWNRRIRILEEGPRTMPNRRPSDKMVIATRLLEKAPDADNLRDMYATYVAARKATHDGGQPPSFEVFVVGVSKQVEMLQNEAGCAEIEVRVVQQNLKVQVRARRRR
jgi:hypothetical protein